MMDKDHVLECAIAAMLGATLPPAPCHHLADCDEPAPNLMPDPCQNCGRWYVNDDNSVERPVRPACPYGNMPRSAGYGHWRDWHRGHGCDKDHG